MAGHLERKHNILPASSDGHVQTAKRKRSAMDNDDNSDDDDNYFTTMEQHAQKRARPNANSTSIYERTPIDAIIPRPMTPPSPPAIGNLTNAGRSANNRQPSNVLCMPNKAYNVVYISDRELNKFMRNGRIGIKNGRLVFQDTMDDDE